MTGAVEVTGWVHADHLVRRVRALQVFLAAADGNLPDARLAPARTVVERAGQRLTLSRDHTVVALAGATGSGKSSLFNAIARMNLSPVGARRPTTGVTYACVWGDADGAVDLLDWLSVLPRHRFTRESELDGQTEVSLRGLVLLDLPDFDSVDVTHRAEVDRILGLVDLVVWVMDPQKYADKLVHESYLRRFDRHRAVTVVVLNHADRLSPADVQRCLADLRGLLDADGLAGVATLASSAYGPPGEAALRAVLERSVATRQAALHRLAADIDRAADELSTTVGPEVVEGTLDDRTIRDLNQALAIAAGVPAVVEATTSAYRKRAAAHLNWPALRWLRRRGPDPFGGLPGPAAASAVTAASRAAAALAVRGVAEHAANALPAPWSDALAAATRVRLDDLPDALHRAVCETDTGLARTPPWWRLVAGVQWLALLAAVAGLAWLLAGYGVRVLDLPGLAYPRVAAPAPLPGLPLPALLLCGGTLLGLAVAALSRPLAGSAARRIRVRAHERLHAAVAEVARERVTAPARAVLDAYRRARDALAVARRAR